MPFLIAAEDIAGRLRDNRQDEFGTMMAYALIWLLRGSSDGADFGDVCKSALYEITDAGAEWNFRLTLS